MFPSICSPFLPPPPLVMVLAARSREAMITAGTIPGVVHEPPNEIRLVPPAQHQRTPRLPPLPPPSVPPPLYSPQQQQQQQQQSRPTVCAVSFNREQCSSSPTSAATATAAAFVGTTPIPAESVAAQNVAADGGWDKDTNTGHDHAVSAEARSTAGEQREDDADLHGESAGNDASPVGRGGARSGSRAERTERKVDWRELKHNVNFLLKEEGPLNPQDFDNCFKKRYRKVEKLPTGRPT